MDVFVGYELLVLFCCKKQTSRVSEIEEGGENASKSSKNEVLTELLIRYLFGNCCKQPIFLSIFAT
jgi:hypothetical protein